METKIKEQFLFQEMLASGLSPEEAHLYLSFNKKCNWESIIRKWRKHAEDSDKNYEAAEMYRKSYTPVTHASLNTQAKIQIERKKQVFNDTLF